MKNFYLLFFFPLFFSGAWLYGQTFTMTNGSVSTCSGTFFDSGGSAGNHGNSESSVFTICSNAGNCVSVTFAFIDLESCCDDLTIYDGNSTASPVIGVFTGTTNPGTITSTSGCLTFEFNSDISVTNSGWEATISCGVCPTPASCLPNMGALCLDSVCSGNFFDSGGSGGNYGNNENLVHTICSNAGNCVEINFSSFNTESGFDELTIFDGPNTAAPSLGTFSGTSSPGTVTSSTGCLTFQFSSDGSVTSTGWDAIISCTAACGSGSGGGCLPNMGTSCLDSTCTGNFFDPGGSGGNYGNNENRVHTICSDVGSCVQVGFTQFALESCCDELTIFDGPNTLSPLIGVFAGTSPGTVTSTSGCLTFQFTSDGSVTDLGWEALISCVPCPVSGCLPIMTDNCTDNTCSNTFMDPGGSSNYANNLDVVHTICSNAGNCVEVDFTSFDLETGFDFLYIYDGGSVNTPLLGVYTGLVSPGTVVGTSGCLTFRFTSDGSTTRPGWTANVSCVTCPATTSCLIDPVANSHGFPTGFTQACDDACSSSNIPLGFTYDICGLNFNSMFVNMNGNITFGSSYTTFTPVGMPNNSTAVMVAPFWADVDTRSCGTVYYQGNPTNTIITWYNVGYFTSHCDKLNTFQLILTNGLDPLIGVGNNTAFYFENMDWTTGDVTGTNGFAGAPATVGVNANDGTSYSAIGRFDRPGLSYDGPAGNSDGVDYLDDRCYVFPAGGCNVILPVGFMKISATPVEGRYISLDWSTNTEFNSVGFGVERSLDGQNFEPISYVPGTANPAGETVDYSYADEQVEPFQRYYYRLKQFAPNGVVAYSTVVQARITNHFLEVGSVFPNPFTHELNLDLKAEKAATSRSVLYDAFGQQVMEWHREVVSGSQILEFPVGDLPHGVYFLHVWVDEEKVALQKVVH